MAVFTGTFEDFENSQMKVGDFSEVTKIFPILAQNFLTILLMNLCNFSAKPVYLQLAQTSMFDEHCYQYTQSMGIWSKILNYN